MIKIAQKTKTPTQQAVVVLVMLLAGFVGINVVAFLTANPLNPDPCAPANVKCVYGPSDGYTTIQSAINAAIPGDTVLIYPHPSGVYTLPSGNAGTIRIKTPNITVKGTGSGTNNAAIIDGVNLPYLDNNYGNVIFVDGSNAEDANNVVVDNLIIIRAGRAGVRVSLADNVTVKNLRIYSSAKWGIVTDFAENILIENNYIDRTTDPTSAQHDIYIANSADHPIIRGNTLINAKLSGLQINGDCQDDSNLYGGVHDGEISDGLIENNTISRNGLGALSIISAPRTTIKNNVLYDNGLDAGAATIHLTDQPAQDGKPACLKPSNDSIVVNNTIYEPRITAIRMTEAATGSKIFNNIIVQPSGKYITDNVGGNFIEPSSNIKRLTVEGFFTNVTNDANPFNDDFHLTKTSPATNTSGITSYQGVSAPGYDFDGFSRFSPFDIGAFEFKTATRTHLQFTQ